MVREWYPNTVGMPPSKRYHAPEKVSIVCRNDMEYTPASTMGTQVNCNIGWYQRSLKGEVKGCTVIPFKIVPAAAPSQRQAQNNATPPAPMTLSSFDFWIIVSQCD